MTPELDQFLRRAERRIVLDGIVWREMTFAEVCNWLWASARLNLEYPELAAPTTWQGLRVVIYKGIHYVWDGHA